ncbi:carboxy terminal-processing peptidase [Ostreibacterium oceani]|uniref:PDZ domain-containing protein n=1 Tax=Ostreibacterium oceani TaxID=2654998 RepID=A0A6N7ETW3_9GAMM|nr:carboxy terminal-processing peptidase [Ostreibacterium oceani]MPV85862.1 PDZ domain-containing protein [Ostreibacterium oceani]
MLSRLILILCVFASLAQAKVEPDVKLEAKPEAKHSAQLKLMDAFLAQHHYQSQLLDDAQSKIVLAKYLEMLDYRKLLFTKKDVDYFSQYETTIDDFVHKGDLNFIFDIYMRHKQARIAQIDWVLRHLEKPMSEQRTDAINTDYDNMPWATDEAARQSRWEQHVQNEWILLRLASQDDEKARETLKKRYENIKKRLQRVDSDEIFQTFANAMTAVYDPHTSYFSPVSSEDFDINMSLSLEGIGAQLTMEEELVTITKLIPGGPAIKSGQIQSGDKILGVAQGKDGPMEDIVGWLTRDAVKLIRGKRGSTVRLRLQRAHSDEIDEITLIRDKINLEESAAKSEIKTIEREGKKYQLGVITIPSFYLDFEAVRRGDKAYRSTTEDVKVLIDALEKEKIDGLVIDLRYNGGGALEEAVNLTGLFFDKGPVVQVRRADGDLTVHEDEDNKTYYAGPLAVLINNQSASASEIFAGAIKDTDRGLVLGQPTFGKGSVQNIIDLERFIPTFKNQLGKLKMTIAMFYRINGSSTQLKGVKPDIYIPNAESLMPYGESEEAFALPWRTIQSVVHPDFLLVKPILPALQTRYDKKNQENPVLQNLIAIHAYEKQLMDQKSFSLDLAKRQSEKTTRQEKLLALQNNYRRIYGYPLLTEDDLDKKETDKSEAEKQADEDYQVDAILDIALETVSDYIELITEQPAESTVAGKKSASE